MIDVTAHDIQTGHRAGRMLEAMLASENKGAKLILTTDVCGPDGDSRYHQTFALRRWASRDGAEFISVTVHGSGDWGMGIKPIQVLQVDLSRKRISEARDHRADDRLLQYAASAALTYAWLGILPTPANGSVRVVEEATCGACGRMLTDPTSIERGIGPECYGKATGGRTITGRSRPLVGQAAIDDHEAGAASGADDNR